MSKQSSTRNTRSRKTPAVQVDTLRESLVAEHERTARAVSEHEAARSIERLDMAAYADADSWEAACRGVQKAPLTEEHAQVYRKLCTLDKALRTMDRDESSRWRTTLAGAIEAGAVADIRKHELEHAAAEANARAASLSTCEALIAAAAAARLELLQLPTAAAVRDMPRGRPAEELLNILSIDLMDGGFTRAEVAKLFGANVTPESVRERARAKRGARKAASERRPLAGRS